MARKKSTTTPAPEATERQVEQPEETTFIGRLIADPVLRQTQSGKSVTTVQLKVNVVVWGANAEAVCKYMGEGRVVEITGRPQERAFVGSDEAEHRVHEIVARRVEFVNSQPNAEVEAA